MWTISTITDAHDEALQMLRSGYSYQEEIRRELFDDRPAHADEAPDAHAVREAGAGGSRAAA